MVLIMHADELLVKMYEDIKVIRNELKELKVALIPEDEPSEDELKEIRSGNKEVEEGRYRSWKRIKRS